ncbi:LpxI family protein [Primorskyibacter sp. S187A]|uniref:LpxI family protein n=1 Tax=Primorskyibacter sp. S187A TaxID=3415130 RepID=UPI003C7DE9ED
MLALIAGEGDLPAAVASTQKTPPLVAALDGFFPDGLSVDPDLVWRVETMGKLLSNLHARGVTDVCLCGAVRRPSVDITAVDEATKPLIPVMQAALTGKGDDGVLRAVISIFETAGFKVRAAHEIAPDLLPQPGVLTKMEPPDHAEADAQLGDLISSEQGRRDLGQACVIRAGRVVAREDESGTDAMLASLPVNDAAAGGLPDVMGSIGELLDTAADWLSGREHVGDGMFFKAPKPGQDRRADLPVIGPMTVASVARAGLAGITLAANGVMVLQRDETVVLADRLGLYIWVRAS